MTKCIIHLPSTFTSKTEQWQNKMKNKNTTLSEQLKNQISKS